MLCSLSLEEITEDYTVRLQLRVVGALSFLPTLFSKLELLRFHQRQHRGCSLFDHSSRTFGGCCSDGAVVGGGDVDCDGLVLCVVMCGIMCGVGV